MLQVPIPLCLPFQHAHLGKLAYLYDEACSLRPHPSRRTVVESSNDCELVATEPVDGRNDQGRGAIPVSLAILRTLALACMLSSNQGMARASWLSYKAPFSADTVCHLSHYT